MVGGGRQIKTEFLEKEQLAKNVLKLYAFYMHPHTVPLVPLQHASSLFEIHV